jgi:hypothetical protein
MPACELEGLPSAIAGFLSHCALSGVVSERKGELQSDQPQNRAPLEAAGRRFQIRQHDTRLPGPNRGVGAQHFPKMAMFSSCIPRNAHKD